jgi:hypothetical protein
MRYKFSVNNGLETYEIRSGQVGWIVELYSDNISGVTGKVWLIPYHHLARRSNINWEKIINKLWAPSKKRWYKILRRAHRVSYH